MAPPLAVLSCDCGWNTFTGIYRARKHRLSTPTNLLYLHWTVNLESRCNLHELKLTPQISLRRFYSSHKITFWPKYEESRYFTYTFSRTMPLAWEAPPNGLAFHLVPMWAFLNSLSAHRCSRRWFTCFRAVRIPRGLPETLMKPVTTNVYIIHWNRHTTTYVQYHQWRNFYRTS